MSGNPYQPTATERPAEYSNEGRFLVWLGLALLFLAFVCLTVTMLLMLVPFDAAAGSNSSPAEMANSISFALLPSILAGPLGIIGMILLIVGILRQSVGKPPQQLPRDHEIAFADNVRVISSEETNAAGIADLRGHVRGITTPSAIAVDVIGQSAHDQAFNVYFQDLQRDYWIAPSLLRLVDHAPGTEFSLDAVGKKWTRNAEGGWDESTNSKP